MKKFDLRTPIIYVLTFIIVVLLIVLKRQDDANKHQALKDKLESVEPFLFNLFNESKKTNTKLIITGADAPNNLNLRKDISSRLNWQLVYQLKTLTDDEKKIALTKHAEGKGIVLDKKIIDYCMANLNRDLHYLIAIIDALDEWSLKTKRPITIPLLKQLLV